MADIFISYAKDDAERVRPLAELIRQRGWTVWWDPHIPYGDTWADVIEQELQRATCVLVLWSQASVSSRWVKKEARFGFRRERLVPVLIDDAPLPFEFEDVQCANLIGWRGEHRPELELLFGHLEQLTGSPTPPSVTDANRHRMSGQQLVSDGRTSLGLQELERSLAEYDKSGEWERASAVLRAMLAIDPDNVPYHAKRVDLADRMGSRDMMIEAYLDLARVLDQKGDADGARRVYAQLLTIDPGNATALGAHGTSDDVPTPEVSAPLPEPEAPGSTAESARSTGALDGSTTGTETGHIERSTSDPSTPRRESVPAGDREAGHVRTTDSGHPPPLTKEQQTPRPATEAAPPSASGTVPGRRQFLSRSAFRVAIASFGVVVAAIVIQQMMASAPSKDSPPSPFIALRTTSTLVGGDASGTLYFGNDAGLWRTATDGRTFERIRDGVTALAVSLTTGTVWIGTEQQGIAHSNDKGATWTRDGLEGGRIAQILVDPGTGERVIGAVLGDTAGDPLRGVFRSTDRGQTWARILFRDNAYGANSIAVSMDWRHLYAALTWAVPFQPDADNEAQNFLYASHDGGDSWRVLAPARAGGWLGPIELSFGLQTIYGTVGGSGLYVGDPNGTWSERNVSPPSRVYADPLDRGKVYFADDKILQSIDYGVNWTEISPQLGALSLYIDPTRPGRLVAGLVDGVAVTSDGGRTWTRLPVE